MKQDNYSSCWKTWLIQEFNKRKNDEPKQEKGTGKRIAQEYERKNMPLDLLKCSFKYLSFVFFPSFEWFIFVHVGVKSEATLPQRLILPFQIRLEINFHFGH